MALFECDIQATSGAARALRYTTAHGDFHTPMFMPVGTHATVKGVTIGGLHELGAQVVLASATPSVESWVNAGLGKYRRRADQS